MRGYGEIGPTLGRVFHLKAPLYSIFVLPSLFRVAAPSRHSPELSRTIIMPTPAARR